MTSEDRRRLSQEMMDRIDAVVSGHDTQRSPEADPWYVGRVSDGPLRFEDERRARSAERLDRLAPPDRERALRFVDEIARRPSDEMFQRLAMRHVQTEMELRHSFGFLTTAVRRAEAEANVEARERIARSSSAADHVCRNPSCLHVHVPAVDLPDAAVVQVVVRFGRSMGEIASAINRIGLAFGTAMNAMFGLPPSEPPRVPVPAKRSRHRYGR